MSFFESPCSMVNSSAFSASLRKTTRSTWIFLLFWRPRYLLQELEFPFMVALPWEPDTVPEDYDTWPGVLRLGLGFTCVDPGKSLITK